MLTSDMHVYPDFEGNRSPIGDASLKGSVCILWKAAIGAFGRENDGFNLKYSSGLFIIDNLRAIEHLITENKNFLSNAGSRCKNKMRMNNENLINVKNEYGETENTFSFYYSIVI